MPPYHEFRVGNFSDATFPVITIYWSARSPNIAAL